MQFGHSKDTTLLRSILQAQSPLDKVCPYSLIRKFYVLMSSLQELTDSIAEDWGGKPFVDLKKGWEYFLDQYPQVRGPTVSLCFYKFTNKFVRSIESDWVLQVQATADTLSSTCFTRVSYKVRLKK